WPAPSGTCHKWRWSGPFLGLPPAWRPRVASFVAGNGRRAPPRGRRRARRAVLAGPFGWCRCWAQAQLRSLEDLGDAAGAHGAATLTDGEAEALLHRDRLDEVHRHLGVVAGHDHLGALGQLDDAGDVRGAEVELRTVVRVERVVTPALVLVEDVDLGLELGVRGDGARLHDDLAALDLLALGAAEQQTDVLAGVGVVEGLAEDLDAGDGRLDGLLLEAGDLDLVVHVEVTALDTTGDDGAVTGDREDVLDRHEEGLVD